MTLAVGMALGAGAPARAGQNAWTVPGTVNTDGLNNTRFVSDLALTNPGASPASVTLSFVGPVSLPPRTLTLAGGATKVYRNVLQTLWSASSAGSTTIASDQPLVLRARTYNSAPTGTFGVALPVFAFDRLLSAGQTADSLWVSQAASRSSGYRTNMAVVFPDAGGGEAVVTLFDATGNGVATQRYVSSAPDFQQVTVASLAPGGLSVGRAQIAVTRGRAAGYSVVVDNITGDSSLFPFEALPAGVQDVVVNGVARANGKNGAFFRTDARLYNPGSNDAAVTVRFHKSGPSNPSPQSAVVTVPAGRVVDVVDVLGSILGAPVGSAGALRFRSGGPVAILCRTSNVDPLGVRPGTYGAQQRPVPLASFLSSADAGAVVTAIRQDDLFRTNVGFAAGADGATYRLTLKNAQGTAARTVTASLGTFGWTQPGIADLFPGTTIPADATLLVEVTEGALGVFDSSIDNASGDPVVTPIAALPVTPPASASIGSAGGTITSADGRLTLKVPAGALESTTTISLQPVSNGAPQGIGSAYELTPAGLSFAKSAQLVLAYSDTDVDGSGAGALGVAVQNGSAWHGIMQGSVDTGAKTLSVPIGSTSPATQSSGRAAPEPLVGSRAVFGPYGSLMLTPEKGTLAPAGRIRFSVYQVGLSSSNDSSAATSPLGGAVPLPTTVQVGWFANGVRGGNAGVGYLDDTITAATYTAPKCAPVVNPVLIGVRVAVETSHVDLAANVRIIPKDWQIKVVYSRAITCDLGGGAYPVAYSASHEGTFSVDDSLGVGNYLAGLTRTHSVTSLGHCPLVPSCLSASFGTLDPLTLSDVTGHLEPGNDVFALTLDVTVPGQPPVTLSGCGGTSIPVEAGPSNTINPAARVAIPVYTTTLQDPVYVDTLSITLTPVTPGSCP